MDEKRNPNFPTRDKTYGITKARLAKGTHSKDTPEKKSAKDEDEE